MIGRNGEGMGWRGEEGRRESKKKRRSVPVKKYK